MRRVEGVRVGKNCGKEWNACVFFRKEVMRSLPEVEEIDYEDVEA